VRERGQRQKLKEDGRKERGKEGRKGGRKDGWKEKISKEGGCN